VIPAFDLYAEPACGPRLSPAARAGRVRYPVRMRAVRLLLT
jgi:hypothetical protein